MTFVRHFFDLRVDLVLVKYPVVVAAAVVVVGIVEAVEDDIVAIVHVDLLGMHIQ